MNNPKYIVASILMLTIIGGLLALNPSIFAQAQSYDEDYYEDDSKHKNDSKDDSKHKNDSKEILCMDIMTTLTILNIHLTKILI